jgi:NAD(P)-dependent dehydrogenase (short-subunit alcohol dehydrogenase family)
VLKEGTRMTQRLRGKSAVVTGAGTGGIGGEVAVALANEGAKVVVNDIGCDINGIRIADKVVEEIVKSGGIAVANYDSVATMRGGENIIKTSIDNFGRMDILVNCAGVAGHILTVEMTEEQWDLTINVHLKGHFCCSKAAALEMIKQKSGRIINFSSRGAFSGRASSAYSAAKAGILGFTSMLSSELKEFGITVNAIIPSADTKLFPGPRPKTHSGLPSPMWIEPDYVAPIIVYLATDEAKNVTGKFIYASGGDLCIYAKPLQVPGEAHMFVRKMGKWTIDELSEVIPSLLDH